MESRSPCTFIPAATMPGRWSRKPCWSRPAHSRLLLKLEQGSAGSEELPVGRDPTPAHFDQVDQLGGHHDAGDLGMNVDSPVSRSAGAVDRHREQLVATELEGFQHHGQPGTNLLRALCRDGDRLAVTGASDLEGRVGRKQRGQPVQLTFRAGGMEFFEELLDLEAIHASFPPSMERMSVPICW